jgi:hypothetical protein
MVNFEKTVDTPFACSASAGALCLSLQCVKLAIGEQSIPVAEIVSEKPAGTDRVRSTLKCSVSSCLVEGSLERFQDWSGVEILHSSTTGTCFNSFGSKPA